MPADPTRWDPATAEEILRYHALKNQLLVRTIARWDFESGGYVEFRVSGEVDTTEAVEMAQTMLDLKKAELERRARLAEQSEREEGR